MHENPHTGLSLSYRPLFQSGPSHTATTNSSQQFVTTNPGPEPSDSPSTDQQVPSAQAASKLTEAIDDFLGNLESKFRGISDEVLTKLDDMAERCDRLEAELLTRESVVAEGAMAVGKGKAKEEDED